MHAIRNRGPNPSADWCRHTSRTRCSERSEHRDCRESWGNAALVNLVNSVIRHEIRRPCSVGLPRKLDVFWFQFLRIPKFLAARNLLKLLANESGEAVLRK